MAENTASVESLRTAFDAETARLNAQFFEGINRDGLYFIDDLVRGSFGFCHYNPLSSKKNEVAYNGRNSMRLALASYDCNYASPNWTTFKMMAQKGWTPKKTAQPVLLQNWSHRNVHDEEGKIVKNEDGTNRQSKRVYPNVPFLAYNYDDIEGAPVFEPKKVEHLGEEDTLACAYMVIQAWEAAGGCKVEFSDHEKCAKYNMVNDTVYIPSPERFKTAKAFAGTLFHELIHSTGHKTRTKRFNDHAFGKGSYKYCREELTAEIGATYLECALGIDRDYDQAHFDNHAAYVKSYARKFEDKGDAIFKAANDAKYACRLILEAVEQFSAKQEAKVAFAWVANLDELLAA